MSLFGVDMDFRTIYLSDFSKKEAQLTKPITPPQDSNPVSSPWHEYLVPDESFKYLLPEDGTYEEPSCVLHRNYLQHMPNLGLVKQQLQLRGQSIYQLDFCKIGDFESKKTREARIVPLPVNWATPLSTQRCSYRNPRSIMSSSAESIQFSYKDNLIPNEKERRILKVKTGNSDYMAHVGTLGEFILREKLHGEGRPHVMSLWEVKRRLALLDQGIIQEEQP